MIRINAVVHDRDDDVRIAEGARRIHIAQRLPGVRRVNQQVIPLLRKQEVIWDDGRIRLDTIQPTLERSVDSLRRNNFTPRLLIERYLDTRDRDSEQLQTIGADAGFEIIEIHEHDGNSAPSGPLSN